MKMTSRTLMNQLIRRGFGLGLGLAGLIWLAAAITVNAAENSGAEHSGQPVRGLSWFLKRMRTVDHLPELEKSLYHGSGNWNPKEENMDITWFRGVKDDYTNVLIDADGPGSLAAQPFGMRKPRNPRGQTPRLSGQEGSGPIGMR